jgi:uncharacterized protein
MAAKQQLRLGMSNTASNKGTSQSDDAIPRTETLHAQLPKDNLFRVLALDGGGAKGFYTLGVLKEIEGLVGCPLYKRFDLIFGTSTGSIIGALLALGCEVDQIHELYKKYVPTIMQIKDAAGKSAALKSLGTRSLRIGDSML